MMTTEVCVRVRVRVCFLSASTTEHLNPPVSASAPATLQVGLGGLLLA